MLYNPREQSLFQISAQLWTSNLLQKLSWQLLSISHAPALTFRYEKRGKNLSDGQQGECEKVQAKEKSLK